MNDSLFSSSRSKVLMAPKVMNPHHFDAQYVPVDCDFTDELEYVVVKKLLVEIQLQKSATEIDSVTGYIVDIYTFQKEEFVKLADGATIRLDRLVQIKILDQQKNESESNCDVNGVCEIKAKFQNIKF